MITYSVTCTREGVRVALHTGLRLQDAVCLARMAVRVEREKEVRVEREKEVRE